MGIEKWAGKGCEDVRRSGEVEDGDIAVALTKDMIATKVKKYKERRYLRSVSPENLPRRQFVSRKGRFSTTDGSCPRPPTSLDEASRA